MEKIKNEEFVEVIRKAVRGDGQAIWEIIQQYEGVIVNNSIIDGELNEECRTYIEEKIFKNISKFKKT